MKFRPTWTGGWRSTGIVAAAVTMAAGAVLAGTVAAHADLAHGGGAIPRAGGWATSQHECGGEQC